MSMCDEQNRKQRRGKREARPCAEVLVDLRSLREFDTHKVALFLILLLTKQYQGRAYLTSIV